jgi:hypothetical protein
LYLRFSPPAVFPEQKLERAGREVPDRRRPFDAHLAHLRDELRRGDGTRGLLDHLLVASLDRAVSLEQMDDVAVLVTEDLDLDVARVHDRLLDVDGAVAEGAQRLAAGALQRGAELGRVMNEAHALAAAAHRGLQHDGVADALRRGERLLERVGAAARRDRDPRGGHLLSRGGLGAHGAHRRGGWADERDARGVTGLAELGVLAEEAVARMDGVGAGLLRRVEHAIDAEVALGGGCGAERHREVGGAHVERALVGVAVDRHRLDAHLVEGARDADGDLAAVRDEDFLDHDALLPAPSLGGKGLAADASASVTVGRGAR